MIDMISLDLEQNKSQLTLMMLMLAILIHFMITIIMLEYLEKQNLNTLIYHTGMFQMLIVW